MSNQVFVIGNSVKGKGINNPAFITGFMVRGGDFSAGPVDFVQITDHKFRQAIVHHSVLEIYEVPEFKVTVR